MPVKILVVIPTLTDDPMETIESVVGQTVEVSKILVAVGSKLLYRRLAEANLDNVEYVYVKPNFRDPVGKRVAAALNVALSKVRLGDYDYLLRVDADTTLPCRFLEENLKADVDCVGRAGYAMLIKMDSFIKYFNGRFVEIGSEDSYIVLKLLSQGRDVISWMLPPRLKRMSGVHHPWRYYFVRGVEMYKLGYEPFHVLRTLLHDIRSLFMVLGYFICMLRRVERYEFAGWTFRSQVHKLIFGNMA